MDTSRSQVKERVTACGEEEENCGDESSTPMPDGSAEDGVTTGQTSETEDFTLMMGNETTTSAFETTTELVEGEHGTCKHMFLVSANKIHLENVSAMNL